MMIARLLLAVVLLLTSGTAALAQQTGDGRVLDLMTFNIRYAHTTPPDLWPDRRPVVQEMIQGLRPDIIGTQEGLYGQLRDMEDDLPDYGWIGLGRDGGSRGEFMAIYYLRERFAPVAYDHFWLSDTPEVVGSRSWGNRINRMVTWVRFQERNTGCEFYVINTHFDHESQPARERSAALLLERSGQLDPSLPVLLLGDFNAGPDNPVYAMLTAGETFVDTWRAAGHAEPEIGTFHGFRGIEAARGRDRIDWILKRGPVTTLSSEILTFARGTQFPSDHFPVVAQVRLDGCP
jgi:endonuclease/exonuclease/phosphatase family metal-dependent hydrolase